MNKWKDNDGNHNITPEEAILIDFNEEGERNGLPDLNIFLEDNFNDEE